MCNQHVPERQPFQRPDSPHHCSTSTSCWPLRSKWKALKKSRFWGNQKSQKENLRIVQTLYVCLVVSRELPKTTRTGQTPQTQNSVFTGF